MWFVRLDYLSADRHDACVGYNLSSCIYMFRGLFYSPDSASLHSFLFHDNKTKWLTNDSLICFRRCCVSRIYDACLQHDDIKCFEYTLWVCWPCGKCVGHKHLCMLRGCVKHSTVAMNAPHAAQACWHAGCGLWQDVNAILPVLVLLELTVSWTHHHHHHFFFKSNADI